VMSSMLSHLLELELHMEELCPDLLMVDQCLVVLLQLLVVNVASLLIGDPQLHQLFVLLVELWSRGLDLWVRTREEGP
jgi:hypothetical protein